jgi:hypothetical protein
VPRRHYHASDAHATAPRCAGQLEQLANIRTFGTESDANPAANQLLDIIALHGASRLPCTPQGYHF